AHLHAIAVDLRLLPTSHRPLPPVCSHLPLSCRHTCTPLQWTCHCYPHHRQAIVPCLTVPSLRCAPIFPYRAGTPARHCSGLATAAHITGRPLCLVSPSPPSGVLPSSPTVQAHLHATAVDLPLLPTSQAGYCALSHRPLPPVCSHLPLPCRHTSTPLQWTCHCCPHHRQAIVPCLTVPSLRCAPIFPFRAGTPACHCSGPATAAHIIGRPLCLVSPSPPSGVLPSSPTVQAHLHATAVDLPLLPTSQASHCALSHRPLPLVCSHLPLPCRHTCTPCSELATAAYITSRPLCLVSPSPPSGVLPSSPTVQAHLHATVRD
ncbi:unnamed protein product, partial [Closterium sp. NIES-54]